MKDLGTQTVQRSTKRVLSLGTNTAHRNAAGKLANPFAAHAGTHRAWLRQQCIVTVVQRSASTCIGSQSAISI